MHAVHISNCVVLLVAIVNATPKEGKTIYITGPAKVIKSCPGDGYPHVAGPKHAHVPTDEQCTGRDGFCVETGDHCSGTFSILHNSCNDHCFCCIPDKKDMPLWLGLTHTKCNTDPSQGEIYDPCGSLYDGVCGGKYCKCPPNMHEDPALSLCVAGASSKLSGGIDLFDDLPFYYNPLGGGSSVTTPVAPLPHPPPPQPHPQPQPPQPQPSPTPKPKKGCPPGLFMSNSSMQCFKIFKDEKRSWEDAKTKCESEGLQLAELSEVVAVTLRKYLLDTYGDGIVWLGSHGDGSQFVWQSNGAVLSSDSPLWVPRRPSTYVTTDWCLRLMVWEASWIIYPQQPYAPGSCSSPYTYTLCEVLME